MSNPVSPTPAAPPRRGSWFNRIGIAVAIGLVALVGHTFFKVYEDRRARERAEALLADAKPYQAEVVRALQARAPMPAVQKVPRHASSMSASADGTIVIEVSDGMMPGGRVVLRPSTNARGEPMWTCAAEKIRPGLLPSWCRP
jgi:hypothetical protein